MFDTATVDSFAEEGKKGKRSPLASTGKLRKGQLFKTSVSSSLEIMKTVNGS
jgi:hypothetical protein